MIIPFPSDRVGRVRKHLFHDVIPFELRPEMDEYRPEPPRRLVTPTPYGWFLIAVGCAVAAIGAGR